MFHGNTTARNCAMTICHYDPFIQNVRLKKATSKRTCFCFKAASGSLHVGLRTFYCYMWQYICHKSTVLQHSIYYVIDSDTWLKGTRRVHCCASNATMVTPASYNVTSCCLSYSKQNWNVSTDFKGAFLQLFISKAPKERLHTMTCRHNAAVHTYSSVTHWQTSRLTGDRIWMVLMMYHEHYRWSKILLVTSTTITTKYYAFQLCSSITTARKNYGSCCDQKKNLTQKCQYSNVHTVSQSNVFQNT
jgi:hypothetical protein